ncbi:hypothetical protein [Massilia endophytica]|uniref:hypothetical protein n=1 Tax=Massilia endophytica TaxID=2899220 RepID=UPI001E442908|nr:hypothetical protein [Massilia endophytica]UGQ45363.1 hypothetical protein LSQ66_16415 [Massilia endophytica]
MFKKLLAVFGGRKAAANPYQQDELNLVYKLLFCDDPSLVAPQGKPASHLFGDSPDPRVVKAIADDAAEESRVRLLAWHWLRKSGAQSDSTELLGVVVEVPMKEGLDALAAYADGSARYINHTGRVAVFEGAPEDIAHQARMLVHAAIPAAAKAPLRERGGPPAIGNVRFSFLGADGLHVREGGFGEIDRDSLAGPVLKQAQTLLDLIVRQAS